MITQPLVGLVVLNLASNLPGPLASHRLQTLGAGVIKIEPPGGDPLARFAPSWYQELSRDQQVITLDLKSTPGRAKLDELLGKSDLLITAYRLAALERLNLSWGTLKSQHPRICQVAILGYPPPNENRPGHDLTYQAELGLLNPPFMPRTLLADFAGAEQAVSAALALLFARERGLGAGFVEVFLYEAARFFSQSVKHRLTQTGGLLGGGYAPYNIYSTLDGWIAVAALEPHFWERLKQEIGLEIEEPGQEDLANIFCTQKSAYWEEWAIRFDLPLVSLKESLL